MILSWTEDAWEDYEYWQRTSKEKVKQLIKAIKRDPFKGIGKPEPLKHDLAGYWSRRIDQEHRLVYEIQDDAIIIVQCRYHY